MAVRLNNWLHAFPNRLRHKSFFRTVLPAEVRVLTWIGDVNDENIILFSLVGNYLCFTDLFGLLSRKCNGR